MGKAKKILVGLVAIYVCVLLSGFLLPKHNVVSRDILINTAADSIFPLISDHKNYLLWSPWAQKDPNTQYTYEGPEFGVGAKVIWHSEHPQVGRGEGVFIEYSKNKRTVMALNFSQGGGNAVFELEPVGVSTTKVQWQFVNTNTHIFARFIGYFFLEGMIGPEYELGLQRLKALVERTNTSPG